MRVQKMKALGVMAAGAAVLMASATGVAKPKPKVTIEGTLGVNASLSHKVLPNYQSTEVFASIKIKAREFVSEERVPLNIALVVDRSSSMAGQKIVQARAAASELLNVLGPQDRLSLISYSSDVSVDVTSMKVTPGNLPAFRQAIEELQPGGYTNLSGGFEQGCEMVSNTIQEGSVNRVILMSDGQANRGVTEIGGLERMADACLKNGVSLTTVGMGLDYNEDLMTAMARKGAGNYHFIENGSRMARVFQHEATGLAGTVARKTWLRVDMAPGVELLKVHGYSHKIDGNTVRIPLSEFASKQEKDILMRLSVSAQKKGDRPVISFRLSYDDVLNDTKVKANSKLIASVSGSKAVVVKNVEKKVVDHAQRVEVAESMDEAMTAYERGDQDRAQKVLEAQRARMNAQRAEFDFEDDASYGRVEGELQDMSSTIKNNSASSSSGKKLRKAKKKRSYDIMNSAKAF